MYVFFLKRVLIRISLEFASDGPLTYWGRVTHPCIGKLTIIGSDNGLSPARRQAIIWTNAGILLIRTLGTNFSEILDDIHTFSFKEMHLKLSSGNWRPFCLGLNVLSYICDTGLQCALRILFRDHFYCTASLFKDHFSCIYNISWSQGVP